MNLPFRKDLEHFSMNEDLPLDENYESKFYPEYYEQDSDLLFSHSEDLNNQEIPQYITEPVNEPSNPFQKEIEPEIFIVPMNQNIIEINEENKINGVNEICNGNKETKNTSLDQKENSISSKRKNIKKFVGRKRKEDTGERIHNKYKPDNQMRKLKSHYNRYFTKKLNSSLSPGHKEFLKINPKVSENLNVDYNMELMQKSLKTIFEENPINGRYSKSEIKKDYNANLIKEIYEKNEEKEAIKILNTTYIEYLDFIRKNELKEFRDEIFKKEVKCGESEKNAKEYVDGLVPLLFDYENWFSRKTSRSKCKNNNK